MDQLLIVQIKDMFFPSRTANVVQSVKMAEAFSRLTLHELWVPQAKTKTMTLSLLKRTYDIHSPIKIVKIPGIYKKTQALALQVVLAYLHKLTFYGSCLLRLVALKRKSVVIYSREYEAVILSWLVSWVTHKKVRNVLEIHELPTHPYDRLAFFFATRMVNQVIAVNRQLKSDLQKRGISATVSANGVSGSWLQEKKIFLTSQTRRKFGISPEQKIILYAGSDLEWKGVEILIKAATRDPNKDHRYFFIGFRRKNMPNCRFFPRTSMVTMATFYRLADLFVLPNSGQYFISQYSTSPLKLFEYLAWRKPVVAADLPSVREIVTQRHVWFFKPDSSRSLLQTINKVLSLPKDKRNKRVKAAFELAKEYTWEKRVQKMVRLIDDEA